MANSSETVIEALLGEDVVSLAADMFVATFTGVGLGHLRYRQQVEKELHRRFGKPRGSVVHHAYQAIAMHIVLVWERAWIAARTTAGALMLLPDGVRLLDTKDVAGGLRAML
jgi:hypothetical protein